MGNCQNFLYKSDSAKYREQRFLLCVLDTWKNYVYICKENGVVFHNMKVIIWETTLREYGLIGTEVIRGMSDLSKTIVLDRLQSNKNREKDNEIYLTVPKDREEITFLQRDSSSC
tara:strand:+ start:973 stop:1317 length:345 start_codon:yes stop_codon:yes gene_type:complete